MRPAKIVVLALVGLGIAGALVLRHQRLENATPQATAGITGARLIELGSTSCKPCKAMHAELAELRKECAASIAVDEIDVWQDEAAAGRYRVTAIPTQVLVDSGGHEIDRHVGYLARSDIRERFARYGIECRR
jgi:thiol-disulfide isomerase/thioredoxin